jgi:hypothetical protein
MGILTLKIEICNFRVKKTKNKDKEIIFIFHAKEQSKMREYYTSLIHIKLINSNLLKVKLP